MVVWMTRLDEDAATHLSILRALDRQARRRLGYGAGPHMFVCMPLPLIEVEAITTALDSQVKWIEAGDPTPALYNMNCSFADIPTLLH